MGPKIKFTKDEIVDAAFSIAETEGLEGMTIRKIAEKLGSSVAPIYVNFKDSDELKKAVVEKIMAISHQLLQEMSTGRPFYDVGRASVKFAQEYSVLFRELVMKKNSYLQDYDKEMLPVLVQEMKKDPELKDFNNDELTAILLKMKIFQTGLSVMAANDLLPQHVKKTEIMSILESATHDVISSARATKNQ